MRVAKVLQTAGCGIVTAGAYVVWGAGQALLVGGVLATLVGVTLELEAR